MPSTASWREILSGRSSDVAPSLLGAVISVGARSARIVEVEAYEGSNDPASHACRGITPRTEVMFGQPGRLYVYLSYGVHWCANVVCHPEGEAGAVLLRAVEPITGIEDMWADRPAARRVSDLGSGPGKLCAALGIGKEHNWVDVLDRRSPVRLGAQAAPGRGLADDAVVRGPRIGISKAIDRPWRFGLGANAHLSRPFPPSVDDAGR